jgi:HD-GYP domain-containing protein (c-di-GMP phosphodiesterase class II)
VVVETSPPNPSNPPRSATPSRWQGRPWLARLVRLTVWSTPVAVSSVAVLGASRAVARPPGGLRVVLWWVGLLALGTLALWMTEKLARRLLPLAALLRLSLAFPDAAPSRFRVALRSGNVRRLQRSPASTRGGGHPGRAARSKGALDTPAEATAELARLVGELHAHDRRTRGHAERVRAYAVMLGEELRLDGDEIDRLQWAALLHDIGKTKVPPEILNKTDPLTDDEYDIIRIHPAEGAGLVEPLRWWLGEWTDAAGQHHERYDGTGYPLRLKGTAISYAGRIVAVADAYDVMTATRSYKKAFDPAIARTELTRCAGTHFDPVVVRAFLSISIGRLERAAGPLSWLANIPIIGTAPLANAAAAAAAASAVVTFNPQVLQPPVPLPSVELALPMGSASALDQAMDLGATAADSPATTAERAAGQGSSTIPLTTATPAPPTVPAGTVPPTEAAATTTASTTEPPTTSAPEVEPASEPDPGDLVVPAADPAPSTDDGGTGDGGGTGPAPPSGGEVPGGPRGGNAPTEDIPIVPSGGTDADPVVPQQLSLAAVSIPRGGFKQLDLLALSGASTLLYGTCDSGTFSFSGAGDPATITPQGATEAYTCEFQADRADGSTVGGSFTVYPT